MYKRSKLLVRFMNKNNLTIFFGTIAKCVTFLVTSHSFITNYFEPFLYFNGSFFNAWNNWIKIGGNSESFPYGLTLYIPLKLIALISNSINLPINLLFLFIYLSIDLKIYFLISKYSKSNSLFYYLNPVIFYVTYIEGQTDLILGLFILLFALNLKKRHNLKSAIYLGLAIGSKFSALLVLPFLIVFFLDNPKFKKLNTALVVPGIFVALINYLPALWSSGFRMMVFGSPEIAHLFDYFIDINIGYIYVFPAIYLGLLVWQWKITKSSINLLLMTTGISIFSLPIFSNSFIGWQLWALPLLFFIQDKHRNRDRYLLLAINILALIRIAESKINYDLGTISNYAIKNTNTFLLVFTLFWIYNSIRRFRNETLVQTYGNTPLVISISGDSSVGKDFLSDNLIEVLGKNCSIKISGDSYHKEERGSLALKTQTILNPHNNDLYTWRRNLVSLLNKTIFSYREYDHSFGRFSEWKHSRKQFEFIVSQGLHANYELLNEFSDLKVHLEIPDSLKLKLKLNRDSNLRNQTEKAILKEIYRRRKDVASFIDIQKDNVDILIELNQKGERNSDFSYTLKFKNEHLFTRFNTLLLNTQTSFLNLDVDENNRTIELLDSKVSADSLKTFLEVSMLDFYDFIPFDFNLNNSKIPILTSIILVCLELSRLEKMRDKIE